MTQVTIVSSPVCGYCHAAKDLLQKLNIVYQEVDLFEDRKQAQDLLSQSIQRTVPQIFINKKPIGGFSELSQLLNDSDFNVTQLSTF